MKKIETWLLTIAVLLCSTTVSAYDFEVDGIFYNVLSTADRTVEVTYMEEPQYEKVSIVYSDTVIIPNEVMYNNSTYSVIRIGDWAFYESDNLKKVIIPNSIKYLGTESFYGCSNLTDIFIPNSITAISGGAFYYSGLTSIVIPNSVKEIGDWTFCCCENLFNITIPNSVTRIGVGAFHGCSNLTNIVIPSSVTEIGEGAFLYTNLPVENNVLYAGSWAVDVKDETLRTYTLRQNTTGLSNTFADCANLVRVTIPDSVRYISDYSFYGCN